MLVFFGTKGKALKGKAVEGTACESCGTTTQVVTPVVRYFHVFWIPVVLYKKLAVLICPHCKKQTRDNEMSSEKASSLKQIAFEGIQTYGYYTGLVFILAASVISAFI